MSLDGLLPLFRTASLNVTSGAGIGTTLDVSKYVSKWVQFVGVTAAAATFVVEGSNDGTNYVALTSNVTADGFVEVPQICNFIQVHRTVAGAGTVTATLGGLAALPS